MIRQIRFGSKIQICGSDSDFKFGFESGFRSKKFISESGGSDLDLNGFDLIWSVRNTTVSHPESRGYKKNKNWNVNNVLLKKLKKKQNFKGLPSKSRLWAIQEATDLKKIKNWNVYNVLLKKLNFKSLPSKSHLWAIQEATDLKKKFETLIMFC